MPWHVEKRDSRFCVIKDADGSNEGCHATRKEANQHMAALYANESEADHGIEFWDGAAALRSCQTVSDYKSVCALDRGESITALSQRFGLPHHPRPGAEPDRQGVASAWAALAGGRTGEPMSGPGVPAARSHLAAHRRAMGIGEAAAEAATGLMFDDAAEEIAASFQTDVEKRTITGLMVPWDKVARAGFSKWRFSRGSLHWGESVGRIKLNLSHDHAEAVGVARRIDNGNAGLYGTFKIARGEAGDKALSLAEDGVMDGFSIEVDFDEGDGWTPDPSNKEVRLVQSGRLAGVALTAFPAFDDARVERVAAAKKRGGQMTEQEGTINLDGEQAAATFDTAMERLANRVTESHQKLTEELTQSVGESISAGVKAALEDISAPQQGPSSVRAARYTVTREEPVYTFNGGGESLVRDAWRAEFEKGTPAGGDALDRLRKYRLQQEEMAKLWNENFIQFTPQSTSSASQIIPPGYRPDLYIPDFERGRPIVALASRGSLDNATPFTVPVFGSVTGASADHVEGTNPSDGSLTFATKTVTPQAISGRLTLTREIVDSSNPAIDTIALFEMRESYARQTETKVYTLLNGTSGAGGTITGDFVPSGAQAVTVAGGTDNQTLVKMIRERLAKYPFNRFASPSGAIMGQGATVRLANSVDTTQRPLFPYIGPTNALGLGNTQSQGWNVDGLSFVPAWANTGVAAGDSQIMIINRSDLWVWESPLLTFRFEEKQGPANIELNVFGYFATHLLRPVGLSGIRIT